MDTLTHALSGVLLARATEPKAPRSDQLPRRLRMWVGFWAAAFPDSDFFLQFFNPLAFLTYHRGVTHSIIMLPLWALLLAAAFVLIVRRKYSWRAFVGVCALGIGIHIAGDVITAFGTVIFAPLSGWRASFPTTFIIDPIFSAVIVGGLIASLLWPRTRTPAVAGLAVLAAYVGVQELLHTRAVALGEAYAAARHLDGVKVQALPQPFSPANWMVVVSNRGDYYLSYISLVRREIPRQPSANAFWLKRVYASYLPATDAEWTYVPRFGTADEARIAETAWDSDALAPFRRFALLPSLYRLDHQGTRLCVWFDDLRFALVGRTMPFRFGACRSGAGAAWLAYRLLTDDKGREFADRIEARAAVQGCAGCGFAAAAG